MSSSQDTSADLVRRLRRLDACTVSDALDRLGLGSVVTGVPQRSGRGSIAGRVVTMKVGVGDRPPGPPRHLGTSAIEAASPDHVIVVEQRSGLEAGCWGGLLTLGAKVRGIAGVVADGPVRDIDEAAGHDFPVFTRVVTARTARGRVVELGTNVPVVFEGIRVDPDMFVLADQSAVIFIAEKDIETVLASAEEIAAKEAAMVRAILAGTPISEVMGGNYEHMLQGS